MQVLSDLQRELSGLNKVKSSGKLGFKCSLQEVPLADVSKDWGEDIAI